MEPPPQCLSAVPGQHDEGTKEHDQESDKRKQVEKR
ncbi:unnamed protein product, partial [marine sediment metagenome]